MKRFRIMRRTRLGGLVHVDHPMMPGCSWTMFGPSAEHCITNAARAHVHGVVALELDTNDRPIAAVEKALAS
jgi:hypothetical protein